jgi:hypothetical protein
MDPGSGAGDDDGRLAPNLQPPATRAKTPRARIKIPPAAWNICGSGEHRTVGRGRKARGGIRRWLGAFHPRPTGEGCPRLPGARPALLPAMLDASPGRFRRVRPFGERTRPLPPAPDGAIRRARQGRVRPASGVTPHRPGARPALASHADRTPPAAHPGMRTQPVPAIRARRPCAIHPDGTGPPRWPGTSFASSRPAGTAPANRNSPPSASQSSVGPGHPCGTEGESSIAWGDRVGTKREFFWGSGAKWQRRTGSGHRRHRKQMTGMGPGGDWWVSEWPGGKAVIDLYYI